MAHSYDALLDVIKCFIQSRQTNLLKLRLKMACFFQKIQLSFELNSLKRPQSQFFLFIKLLSSILDANFQKYDNLCKSYKKHHEELPILLHSDKYSGSFLNAIERDLRRRVVLSNLFSFALNLTMFSNSFS